jgi:hypothetical protein
LTISDPGRLAIWTETLLAVLVYAAIVIVVGRIISLRWTELGVFWFAVAFLVVQAVEIGLMMIRLLAGKIVQRRRARRAQRIDPRIGEKLALYAVGADEFAELERLARRYPANFERCILEFVGSIRGGERARLCALADRLGVVKRWTRRARSIRPARRLAAITSLEELGVASAPKVIHAALADRDEDVRIEASRALIRSGADDDIRESLAFATTQPPLVRAVLAEDLKQHVEVLCKGAIQQLLKSTDTARVLATLEIIESWQKHPEDAVRAQALRVLPYAAGDEDARNDVIPGLEDESPGVRAAAAAAAARMQLSAAVKPLAQCLHDRRGEVALAAAFALAQLGEAGLSTLEREILSDDRAAATVALEALERFRIGRTELVTF